MPGTYISPAETGFYYLQDRYYDPVIGRFINIDDKISDVGGAFLGYNMYTYCMNNPVNLDDQDGNWGKLLKKIANKVKAKVNKSVNKIKNVVKKVKSAVKKVTTTIKKYVGTSINIGSEKTITSNYGWLYSTENGVGYNKSFSTDKPINLYANFSDDSWEIWDNGYGVDVNVDGYGGSIQFGNDCAASVHLDDHSYELGVNSLGRIYYKHAYSIDDAYYYNKYSLNGPEIIVTVAACVYGAGYILTLGTSAGAVGLALAG